MSARKLRKNKRNIVWLNEKDAFWQYILDHALVDTNGHFRIVIGTIKNRESFEKSIQARQRGMYRFTEEEVRAKIPVHAKGTPNPRPKRWEMIRSGLIQIYKAFR